MSSFIKFTKDDLPKIKNPVTIFEEIAKDFDRMLAGESIDVTLKKVPSYTNQIIASIVFRPTSGTAEFLFATIRMDPFKIYPLRIIMYKEMHPLLDSGTDSLASEAEFVGYISNNFNSDDSKNFIAQVIAIA